MVNKSNKHSGIPTKLKPKILQESTITNSPDATIEITDLNQTIKYEIEDYNDMKENNDQTFLELTINEDLNYWTVKNFTKIIKFVYSRNNFIKMLSKNDVHNITIFTALREDYQQLLLKLFSYLPKWYNIHKFVETIKLNLSDEEVVDMYTELKDKGCIISGKLQ